MTTEAAYIPTLPDAAFVPLPEGAEELPGSPGDYHFPHFALRVLGNFEQEDTAARLMVALGAHGSWAAVKYRELISNVAEECARHRGAAPRNVVELSVVAFPDGPRRIIEGLHGLIGADLIGHYVDNGDSLLYIKPALLERLARYRRAANG